MYLSLVLAILFASCWRWIGGHSRRNPAKVSRYSGEHGNIVRISTAPATTEAYNTNLKFTSNKNRSATVSLHEWVRIRPMFLHLLRLLVI